MKKRYTVGIITLLLAFASLSAASQGKWSFDPNTGQGSIAKGDVERALGHRVTYSDAQSLVFTVIDTVDGTCIRERQLRIYLTHTGGDSKANPKLLGFWSLGYESSGTVCSSSAAAGPDATVYVNGIPLQ